jgi:hypothetical protein
MPELLYWRQKDDDLWALEMWADGEGPTQADQDARRVVEVRGGQAGWLHLPYGMIPGTLPRDAHLERIQSSPG